MAKQRLYEDGQILSVLLDGGVSILCTVSGFDDESGKHILLKHSNNEGWALGPLQLIDDEELLVDLGCTHHCAEATPIVLWKSWQIFDAAQRSPSTSEIEYAENESGNERDDESQVSVLSERARSEVLPILTQPVRRAVWDGKLEPGVFWVGRTGKIKVPLPLQELKELQKGMQPDDIKKTNKCKVACFLGEETVQSIMQSASMLDYCQFGKLEWDEISSSYNITIDGEVGPRFIRVSEERIRPKFEAQVAVGSFRAKYHNSGKDGTSLDGLMRLIFRFDADRVMVIVKNPPGPPQLHASAIIRAIGKIEARHNRNATYLNGKVVREHIASSYVDFLSEDDEKAALELAIPREATKKLEAGVIGTSVEGVLGDRLNSEGFQSFEGRLSDGDFRSNTDKAMITELRVTLDRILYRWDIGERVMSRSKGGREKFYPGEIVDIHGGLYDINLDYADEHDNLLDESNGVLHVLFDTHMDIAQIEIPKNEWPENIFIEITTAPILRASWDEDSRDWACANPPISLVPSRSLHTSGEDASRNGSAIAEASLSSKTLRKVPKSNVVLGTLEKAVRSFMNKLSSSDRLRYAVCAGLSVATSP